MPESTNTELQQLVDGGEAGLAVVFSRYQARLERMVEFRMDHRLRGRVDPGDVMQESYIEISRRMCRYLENPEVTVFVWMRQVTLQTLIGVHRRHFRNKRSVGQEVQLRQRKSPDATSYSIAFAAFANDTTPSRAVARAEEIEQLRKALDSMDEIDREVLALRHFEQLSNNEVAEILQLSVTASSNRYVRALARLGNLMEGLLPS